MMLRLLRAAMLLLLTVGGCASEASPPWHEAEGFRWRELSVRERGQPGFTEMSPRRTGVDFGNRLSRALAIEHDHLLVGSGVAVGDYDGDGLADLYFSRLQGPNALYRNLGGWRFEDVTEAAGVGGRDRGVVGILSGGGRRQRWHIRRRRRLNFTVFKLKSIVHWKSNGAEYRRRGRHNRPANRRRF